MNIIEITSENQINQCVPIFMTTNNAPPWNDHWNLEQSTKRLMDIYNSSNFIGFAYTENDKIIGFIIGNFEVFYDGIHYNLKEMAIDNAYQKQGIGSELLKKAIPILKGKGITVIYLYTSKANGTSIFYLKNGFEESNNMIMMWKGIKGNA